MKDIEDNLLLLRPIGFVQRNMDVTLPLSFPDEDEADPTFLPSSERLRLETRLQAIKALQSSYSLKKRFWEIWKNQYLTALRKQHRRNIDNKRCSTREVREGEVVLLTDSFQKRNHWKLARISKLISSSDGAVREVEVYCNKNTLRRPINQLTPLEIEGTNNETERRNMSEDQKMEPLLQHIFMIYDQGRRQLAAKRDNAKAKAV